MGVNPRRGMELEAAPVTENSPENEWLPVPRRSLRAKGPGSRHGGDKGAGTFFRRVVGDVEQAVVGARRRG